MNQYWQDRGFPWEYDPGPPKNRCWPRYFAETPNYRQIFKRVLGTDKTRWYFGPMFYRGRLKDNAVKVVVIGQEGAQDEALSHRAFTGFSGCHLQYFLNYIGVTESYLFLNTFVYSIKGQYSSSLQWLAQNRESPIVRHRHDIFDYALEKNDVRLVIAVGDAAKESVVTWVESRGGTCPMGDNDVDSCSGGILDPHTRIVGVMHPGGVGAGGNRAAIVASFEEAAEKIKQWMKNDPHWLPPDPSGTRFVLEEGYTFRRVPIPFRDFSYGMPLRLGRGATSSIRKDEQRSIQIFSADGEKYKSDSELDYAYKAEGDEEGYSDEEGDLPYEPPRRRYRDYDKGPGRRFAMLLMGGKPGLEWPDFTALGVTAHPSFGHGPIYRGRPSHAYVLVLADQQSHDDLFTGRALTGESGQHMQEFLKAMGIIKRYMIIRPLPVDTRDLDEKQVLTIVRHPQTQKVIQAIADKIISASPDLKLVLAFGPQARALSQALEFENLSVVGLKAWKENDALQDWQDKLEAIRTIEYEREDPSASFSYSGQRGQIPRLDLPCGVPRWAGSFGDRASRPVDKTDGELSPDYYRIFLPIWVYRLSPAPLSPDEESALQHVS